MKITIVGAAGGEVTGSAYYVQTQKSNVLVDCGLFQGGRKSEALNRPPTGSRQKIHLEINQPATPLPKVLADSNRTKQVLINLVGNALKFTETGSVTISFQPEAGYVKTLVTDTGKGIPAESQKFLFKKFEQTGTTVLTRDSVRGTGLGLYISKLIIEQMAGHIGLEASQVGIGTTFGFVLPIVRTNVVQPPTGSPKPLRGEIVPVTVA